MMLRLNHYFSVSLLVLLLFVQGCTNNAAGKDETVFKKIPELAQIKPERPVKIKLKRSTKGDYSWDLHGDDADKVIEVNRKLRDALQQND